MSFRQMAKKCFFILIMATAGIFAWNESAHANLKEMSRIRYFLKARTTRQNSTQILSDWRLLIGIVCWIDCSLFGEYTATIVISYFFDSTKPRCQYTPPKHPNLWYTSTTTSSAGST